MLSLGHFDTLQTRFHIDRALKQSGPSSLPARSHVVILKSALVQTGKFCFQQNEQQHRKIHESVSVMWQHHHEKRNTHHFNVTSHQRKGYPFQRVTHLTGKCVVIRGQEFSEGRSFSRVCLWLVSNCDTPAVCWGSV